MSPAGTQRLPPWRAEVLAADVYKAMLFVPNKAFSDLGIFLKDGSQMTLFLVKSC